MNWALTGQIATLLVIVAFGLWLSQRIRAEKRMAREILRAHQPYSETEDEEEIEVKERWWLSEFKRWRGKMRSAEESPALTLAERYHGEAARLLANDEHEEGDGSGWRNTDEGDEEGIRDVA